jgi:predicted RNA binding protein YcfA (HicA-like mRNA interferase family)
MPRLPSVRPEAVARVAQHLGFVLDRQRGSHAVYFRPSDQRRVVIAMHGKDLKRGVLRGLVSDLGLTVQEFCELL